MLPEISLSVFYPIILPYSYSEIILPELREVLRNIFVKLDYSEEIYELSQDFLLEYHGNKNNYDSYRFELVVFLNWCWANNIDVRDIRRKEMFLYISFCNSPPLSLISKSAARTILFDKKIKDEFALNLDWRPFKNSNPELPYSRTKATITKMLSVLSAFFTYLNDVEYLMGNPAAVALRRININTLDNVKPTSEHERSLSMLQLATVFDVLEDLCRSNPARYERSRFLFYLLILIFPRRSEISASITYSPCMNDFQKIRIGDDFRWVFHIRKAKRGKSRKVLCPNKLIDALIRYRKFLGLNELPGQKDYEPIFIRHRPASHGREAGIVDANLSSNAISGLVLELFSITADRLEFDMDEPDEARQLRMLSTHSTRHTGISLALSAGRSPEKLMIDTGHSSFTAFKIYMSNKVDFRLGEVDLIDAVLDKF